MLRPDPRSARVRLQNAFDRLDKRWQDLGDRGRVTSAGVPADPGERAGRLAALLYLVGALDIAIRSVFLTEASDEVGLLLFAVAVAMSGSPISTCPGAGGRAGPCSCPSW